MVLVASSQNPVGPILEPPVPFQRPKKKEKMEKNPGVTADINSFKIYQLTNIIKCPRNKQPADLTHLAISPQG